MANGRVERAIRRRVFGRAPRRIDKAPPRCPPGWTTGPPDFVGVGVQRGGTSWWFAELDRHPDLRRAADAPKEVHFFDSLSGATLSDAHVARYEQWFPRPAGGIVGEWTPIYAYEPWTVPMLARAAPEARFLMLLRNPMDRFHSGVTLGLKRGNSHGRAVVDAFQRGLYAGQVARLLTHLRRDQILFLVYEELRSEPQRQRHCTAEFIGLDPDRFTTPVRVRPAGARAHRDGDMSSALLSEVAERYRDDVVELARLLPELDFDRWVSHAR